MTLKEVQAALTYRPTLAEVFMNTCSIQIATVATDHAKLGAMLRKIRIAQGMSLRAMANGKKVSPAYVSDLERGRRNWSHAHVEEYLKLLPQQPEPPSLKIR